MIVPLSKYAVFAELTQSRIREIVSRHDIFQRHRNCVASTYIPASFQWSDIQRHV